MKKHPVLGWPPPAFRDPEWHQQVDETLARGLPSAARKLVDAVSEEESTRNFKRARVGVLRTFSLELSESLLSLAFIRWQVIPEFQWLDFNSFEAELSDSASRL